MVPRCWRATDAAGENRSNTHPVCGNAAPPLNPVATWLLWSSSHFWQLPRWLQEKLWCTGLGEESKNQGCSCLLSAGAFQRTQKDSMGDPPHPFPTTPCNCIAAQEKAFPTPAKLRAPHFPLDLCEKELLAARTEGSLRLEI